MKKEPKWTPRLYTNFPEIFTKKEPKVWTPQLYIYPLLLRLVTFGKLFKKLALG
jgi:hypothetical protein